MRRVSQSPPSTKLLTSARFTPTPYILRLLHLRYTPAPGACPKDQHSMLTDSTKRNINTGIKRKQLNSANKLSSLYFSKTGEPKKFKANPQCHLDHLHPKKESEALVPLAFQHLPIMPSADLQGKCLSWLWMRYISESLAVGNHLNSPNYVCKGITTFVYLYLRLCVSSRTTEEDRKVTSQEWLNLKDMNSSTNC